MYILIYLYVYTYKYVLKCECNTPFCAPGAQLNANLSQHVSAQHRMGRVSMTTFAGEYALAQKTLKAGRPIRLARTSDPQGWTDYMGQVVKLYDCLSLAGMLDLKKVSTMKAQVTGLFHFISLEDFYATERGCGWDGYWGVTLPSRSAQMDGAPAGHSICVFSSERIRQRGGVVAVELSPV